MSNSMFSYYALAQRLLCDRRMTMKWLPFQHLPSDQSPKNVSPSSMAGLLAKRMPEIRRLAQQHVELKREMQGNFLAPITAPGAILDFACENGRWAMEVAAQFPAARVV